MASLGNARFGRYPGTMTNRDYRDPSEFGEWQTPQLGNPQNNQRTRVATPKTTGALKSQPWAGNPDLVNTGNLPGFHMVHGAKNQFSNTMPTNLGTTPTTTYTENKFSSGYTPQAIDTSYTPTSLDFTRNLKDVSVSDGGAGASARRDLFTNPEWAMSAAGYDPRDIIGSRLGQRDYFTNAENQITGGLRGFDQLEEIARTGGFNDSIRDMIRSRSASPALSALGDITRRQNRAQTIGNYNVPGMQDAQTMMNNRAMFSALGDIGRSTEIDLAERALQNRLGAASALGNLDLSRADRLLNVGSQRLGRDESIFDRMESARRFNQSEDTAAKTREQQALEAYAARQAAASALQAQLDTQMNLAENQFALGRAGLQEQGNQRAMSHALGRGSLTNQANQIASTHDLGLGKLNEVGNQRRANVGMFDANLGEQGRQADNSLNQRDRQFLADLQMTGGLGLGSQALQQLGLNQNYDLGLGALNNQRHGIDTQADLSRYGIDKNYDLSKYGIDTQAGQQSADRKSSWWSKILGAGLMGLGGIFGAGPVTTPLGMGMMRG